MHTAKLFKKYVLYNATWDIQNALHIFHNSATQKLAKNFLKNTIHALSRKTVAEIMRSGPKWHKIQLSIQ